jgi:hypothetical protein
MAWRSRSAAVVELAPPAVVIFSVVGSQWVGSRRWVVFCVVKVESVGTALEDLERSERRGRGLETAFSLLVR